MAINSKTTNGKTNGKRTIFQRFRDYVKGGESKKEEDDSLFLSKDALVMLNEGKDLRPYIFPSLEQETGKKNIKFNAYVDENGVKTVVREDIVIPNTYVRGALYDSAGEVIKDIPAFYEKRKQQPAKNYSFTEKITYQKEDSLSVNY